MEHTKALAILDALSGGIDPVSGESFPADSPYQHPDVVRALFHAIRLLGGDVASAASPSTAAEATASAPDNAGPAATKAPRATPGNTGKPWSTDEDDRLVAAFDTGTAPPDLARIHGRSKFAIEVRLARFERVPLPQGTRFPPRAAKAADATTSPQQAGESNTSPLQADESNTSPLQAGDAAVLRYQVVRHRTPQHSATGALQ